MGPAEFALGIILAVVIFSFYLQVKDRSKEPSIPPEPPILEITIQELKEMTKAELIEYAGIKGLDIPPSWNKARIVARLIEHLGL